MHTVYKAWKGLKCIFAKHVGMHLVVEVTRESGRGMVEGRATECARCLYCL